MTADQLGALALVLALCALVVGLCSLAWAYQALGESRRAALRAATPRSPGAVKGRSVPSRPAQTPAEAFGAHLDAAVPVPAEGDERTREQRTRDRLHALRVSELQRLRETGGKVNGWHPVCELLDIRMGYEAQGSLEVTDADTFAMDAAEEREVERIIQEHIRRGRSVSVADDFSSRGRTIQWRTP